MDKKQVMSMLSCNVNDNLSLSMKEATSGSFELDSNTTGGSVDLLYRTQDVSCWDFWHREYYPQIITESYPVYIREQAQDKGKHAYEIIKILKDKKLVNITTVGKFIDLMDTLIKIL